MSLVTFGLGISRGASTGGSPSPAAGGEALLEDGGLALLEDGTIAQLEGGGVADDALLEDGSVALLEDGSAALLEGGSAPTLREAIRAWLVGQSAVASLVGQGVYFGVPSQLAAYPCLVVLIPRRTYGHNLGGADGTSVATVEIGGFGLREAQCVAMAEAIRAFADGFQGVQSGVPIMSCLLDEPSEEDPVPVPAPDGSDRHIYQITLDFRVKHRVPAPVVTQTRI